MGGGHEYVASCPEELGERGGERGEGAEGGGGTTPGASLPVSEYMRPAAVGPSRRQRRPPRRNIPIQVSGTTFPRAQLLSGAAAGTG